MQNAPQTIAAIVIERLTTLAILVSTAVSMLVCSIWISDRTIRDTSSSTLSVKVAQSGEAATRSVVRRCCSAIVLTQFARRASRKREAQQGGDHGWPGYPAVDT